MKSVLFDGIATIENFPDEGSELDVHMNAEMIHLGELVSWRGTFSVMTPGIREVLDGEYSVELSDSRRCVIRARLDEDGKYIFQGVGYPPGFQKIGSEVVQIASSTPTWKVFAHNAFLGAAAGLITSAFWIDGRGLELVGTGVMAAVVGIALYPNGRRS